MDKKTGYALLWGGVGIILYSVVMAWKVFGGSAPPPNLIDMKSVVLPLPNMQFAMPLDPNISKTANISLYFMFLFFLSSAGGRIANLGVKLVREPKPEPQKPGPQP
ncbi:MAG: hypothetical protein WCK76_00670 [Elusimicrobiota bacterium]